MKIDICNAEIVSPEIEMLCDRSKESIASNQNKGFKTEIIKTHENYNITKSETNQ